MTTPDRGTDHDVNAELVRETARTYDEIAAAYAARAQISPHVAATMDGLTKLVPSGSLVADVGCGPGHLTAALRDRGFRTVGLDLSMSMLELARPHTAVVLADQRALPVRLGALDVVWSYAALLHVPRLHTAGTLAGWHRAVRDDGVLVLSTSVGEGEGIELAPVPPEPGASRQRRWFVHRTEREIDTAVESAGFRIVETRAHQSHRRWHVVIARA